MVHCIVLISYSALELAELDNAGISVKTGRETSRSGDQHPAWWQNPPCGPCEGALLPRCCRSRKVAESSQTRADLRAQENRGDIETKEPRCQGGGCPRVVP